MCCGKNDLNNSDFDDLDTTSQSRKLKRAKKNNPADVARSRRRFIKEAAGAVVGASILSKEASKLEALGRQVIPCLTESKPGVPPEKFIEACKEPGARCRKVVNPPSGREEVEGYCIDRDKDKKLVACFCEESGKGYLYAFHSPIPLRIGLDVLLNLKEISFSVDANDFIEQRNFIFDLKTGAFDAKPKVSYLNGVLELTDSVATDIVQVRIAQLQSGFESFKIHNLGGTGFNHEQLIAGNLLLNIKTGVFEGQATLKIINDIFGEDNPILVATSVYGQFNFQNDTILMRGGAPGEALQIPKKC